MERTAMKRLMVVLGISTVMASTSAAPAAVVIAKYNFAHAPATSDVLSSSTPYYITDAAGDDSSASLATNPNIVFSPDVQDASTNNRDLVHENRFNAYDPGSNSSARVRYATSKASAGGSGDQGIYASDGNNTVLLSNGTFARSEYATQGFTIETNLEFEKTTSAAGVLAIAAVNNISLVLRRPNPADSSSGQFAASITGTFSVSGLGSPVLGTTNPLKSTTPGSPRREFSVRLTWDPKLVGGADDTLSLYVNGVLESSVLAQLSATDNGRLSVLGFGNGVGVLNGVMMKDLTIYQGVVIPEPTGAAALIGLSAILARRRRR